MAISFKRVPADDPGDDNREPISPVASENTPAELIPDGAADQLVAVHLDDFVAYMPMHNYVFLPTREPWPAASVNARIPAWAPSTAS